MAMMRLLLLFLLLGGTASGAVFNVPVAGTGSGAATNAQPPSTTLTNLSGTGAITNAPWTTNLMVGYDLGAAVSNLPNNSVANILPGTHTVTPVIAFTNAGVLRFPPLVLMNKTNVTLNLFGTINGSSALGTIMLITNCSRITINGHNSGVFLGSRQTNIATLIPTNVSWGLISYYHCADLTFKNFYLTNAHYHGIIDWGASFGNIASTNGILFDTLDVRWCGSKMTNNSINWDGAGILPSGGTVRNCYLRDNFRGVEVYTSPSGLPQTDNTIVEKNIIYDTLDVPITTSGSTNNNRLQLLNNFIYQTKGYTRHGTNYLYETDALIRVDGGHSHVIKGNTLIGTNGIGISIGGYAGDNIATIDNYIDGPTTGVIYGYGAVAQAQHKGVVCRGNIVLNSGSSGFAFNACLDGLISHNEVRGVRANFSIGFNLLTSQLNTNLFFDANVVKDSSGFLYSSYTINAGSHRIIMSNNDGTNGTLAFISNLAGTGLIYRGQRNDSGFIEFSETPQAAAYALGPTNSNYFITRVANSNSVPVTNIVGLIERGSSTPIVFDCNLAHQYVITNRITAASTYVFTNTWRGQEYNLIVPGEASGGASRVITLVPTLGDLVANLDVFGTALATSGSFTLTNGNAAEVSVRVSRFNGTNIFGFVSRQYSF